MLRCYSFEGELLLESQHFIDLPDGEYILLYISNDKFYTKPVLNYDKLHDNLMREVYFMLLHKKSKQIFFAHAREGESSAKGLKLIRQWIDLYNSFLAKAKNDQPFFLKFTVVDNNINSFNSVYICERDSN